MKILCMLMLSIAVQAKPIKVLVVDTGVDLSHKEIKKYTDPKEVAYHKFNYTDKEGHGTHVAGLILKNVCPQVQLISCRFYDRGDTNGTFLQKTINCFNKALEEHIDFINYSAGGNYFSTDERNIIIKLGKAGTTVVVAAGNEAMDISNPFFSYYPASYGLSNVVVVGSWNEQWDIKSFFSNYGWPGMVYEYGEDVFSALPNGNYGLKSGTSQATAIRTNRLLKKKCLEK